MTSDINKDKPGTVTHNIHILGPNHLQNQLLGHYLEQKSGVSARHGDELDQADSERLSAELPALLLIDCHGAKNLQQFTRFLPEKKADDSTYFTALFNVSPDQNLERAAVDLGFRGIFYVSDSTKMIGKGVREILKGELWYSRKAMSRYLLEKRSFSNLSTNALEALTFREREILLGIAAGASNKEIAEDLHISLHTVKTHVYNVYKKINVPNRLQAALWAAQYL